MRVLSGMFEVQFSLSASKKKKKKPGIIFVNQVLRCDYTSGIAHALVPRR